MKKRAWIVAIMIALAISGGSALAAVLSNLSGQSCGEFEGTWHFVNNQTGGAAAGSLTAYFDSAPGGITVGPSSVLANTQHFYVIASGALLGAQTDLPGRLVLSDFTCSGKKTGGGGK